MPQGRKKCVYTCNQVCNYLALICLFINLQTNMRKRNSEAAPRTRLKPTNTRFLGQRCTTSRLVVSVCTSWTWLITRHTSPTMSRGNKAMTPRVNYIHAWLCVNPHVWGSGGNCLALINYSDDRNVLPWFPGRVVSVEHAPFQEPGGVGCNMSCPKFHKDLLLYPNIYVDMRETG